MRQHILRMLFSPKSVAVIGASERANAVGEIVFRNMLESGYGGLLYAVNPAHQEVQGQRAYATIEEIETPVELAVICTEAETVPDIIESCGKHGVRAAVVLSAGFTEVGPRGAALAHPPFCTRRSQKEGIGRRSPRTHRRGLLVGEGGEAVR